MKKIIILLFLSLNTSFLIAQKLYRYSLDLNKVSNDQVEVSLLTPRISSKTVVYTFPKIIPGTYSISNYGIFIDSLRAFDAQGKPLKVARLNDNQWQISSANKMAKISYYVEDSFDSEKKHSILPIAGTNIDLYKSYVINSPGFFGYFNNMRNAPVEVLFEKPSHFYASTSLIPVKSTKTTDLFRVGSIHDLYDSPIMYTLPDTTTIQVANCKVLVSVFSPNHVINSKEISQLLAEVLKSVKDYVGGRLPVSKYTFLYYFKDPQSSSSFHNRMSGALEHRASSFYYLNENPIRRQRKLLIDISSHEFLHVITPLLISSKEVKYFNFDEPVLSKHLWLYEGVTEYTAHHMQVYNKLKPIQEYLNKLSEKISISRSLYNDTLSFTSLSKLAATTHASQYGNVYEKGALIATCLDLLLLNKSEGKYGLKNLISDLALRYKNNRHFNDDDFFEIISKSSFPEVKDFLVKYVEGSSSIPYEDYFSLAGINLIRTPSKNVFSMGGINPSVDKNERVIISSKSRFNDFGRKMGYQIGDKLYSFNDHEVNPSNFDEIISMLKENLKEGDVLRVKIGRLNKERKLDTLYLSSPVELVTEKEEIRLELMGNPSSKQMIVQKAWLITNETRSKE